MRLDRLEHFWRGLTIVGRLDIVVSLGVASILSLWLALH
jgi:hypothetical protein